MRPPADRRAVRGWAAGPDPSADLLCLAIEGRSPYLDRAAFIDADTRSAGHDLARAADVPMKHPGLKPDVATR